MDIANFQKKSVKSILKNVTPKFIGQQQQFYAQLEIVLKTKYVNGFKIFRETLTYNCVQKIFIEAFNCKKKHTKFI